MKHSSFFILVIFFFCLTLWPQSSQAEEEDIQNLATQTICNLAHTTFAMGARFRCEGMSEDEAIAKSKSIAEKNADGIPVFKQDPELRNAAISIALAGVRSAYAVKKLDCNDILGQAYMFKLVCISEIGKRIRAK